MKKLIYPLLAIFATAILVGSFWFFALDQSEGESGITRGDKESSEVKSKPENKELLSYETEAESPDECSSYEKFDTEAKVCFYECRNEAECTQIQNKIDTELSSWDDQARVDSTPNNDKGISDNSEDSIIAKYNVTTGEKITFASGKDTDEYRKLWNDVAALSPDRISDKYISSFEIYSDKNSDSIAYVNQIDNSNKWRMVINVDAYNQQDLREQRMTLIHELGHIISLNDTQVTANQSSCPRLNLDEGCAIQGSYIQTFWEKFWKNLHDVTPAYDPNKYVDEYATTNETEDWAETFAFFVVGNQDNTTSVRAQKIQMMYSFPDLVTIRTDMRNVLGRDIVRARKLNNN